MTKNNFFKSPLLRYFRELSIVILGVAVTFAGSAWFTSRNTDKQLKYYFNAIKMEMEANLQQVETLSLFLEYSTDFADYLNRTPVNQLNPDSISKWDWDDVHKWTVTGTTWNTPLLMNDAFETFKSSGMMSYSKTPELLLQIQVCYTNQHLFENSIGSYMQEKYNKGFIGKFSIKALSNPDNKPYLLLMSNKGLIESKWSTSKHTAESIKACIASIEKSRYALSSKNS